MLLSKYFLHGHPFVVQDLLTAYKLSISYLGVDSGEKLKEFWFQQLNKYFLGLNLRLELGLSIYFLILMLKTNLGVRQD